MASNILLTPNATHQKRALLIGNDTYSQGNRLHYCVNDATDLADKLRCVNFQVTIGTNLICEQMDLMIEEFSNTICSGDLVLFFFSGHGRQLNDQNFLIPVDDDRTRGKKRDSRSAYSTRTPLYSTRTPLYSACTPKSFWSTWSLAFSPLD
jgi:uncharacterized caspase-like protein